MNNLVFATSNLTKFSLAQQVLQTFGVELTQHHLELQELQSTSGKEIVLHKAEQAYAQLQMPVLVSDDTWLIHGLNGFPGPYMKDMNHWFTGDDFMHLTQSLSDRRVTLQQHTVYRDANGAQHFSFDIHGQLLDHKRGSDPQSPNHEVISFDGGQHSAAELVVSQKSILQSSQRNVWHVFGEWARLNLAHD